MGSAVVERSLWLFCRKWAFGRSAEKPFGRLLKPSRLKLMEAGAVVVECSGLWYSLMEEGLAEHSEMLAVRQGEENRSQ